MFMTGEYRHSLDSKGRVFIPARLREEIGDVFYITLSMDHCLNVYSDKNWGLFTERVNGMSYISQRKMRPLFAHAVDVNWMRRAEHLFLRHCVIMQVS